MCTLNIKIELQSREGEHVKYAAIPAYAHLPEMVSWGIRHFQRWDPVPDVPIYREGFCHHIIERPRSADDIEVHYTTEDAGMWRAGLLHQPRAWIDEIDKVAPRNAAPSQAAPIHIPIEGEVRAVHALRIPPEAFDDPSITEPREWDVVNGWRDKR